MKFKTRVLIDYTKQVIMSSVCTARRDFTNTLTTQHPNHFLPSHTNMKWAINELSRPQNLSTWKDKDLT